MFDLLLSNKKSQSVGSKKQRAQAAKKLDNKSDLDEVNRIQ
jgi:hypothetical protein